MIELIPLQTHQMAEKKLNPEQLSAVEHGKGPLLIIAGAGTGKTTVITEIVFQILAQKPEAKILITSQTNPAVDQVLENLINNEIQIFNHILCIYYFNYGFILDI
jgi:superfamily I DNA/RNA helicase